MGTFDTFRKAYGALKDTATVGLANFNSEFKDLDIAIVKATNHNERPPKERHVRKIFFATSIVRPRADVAYCIHALARRLAKTRNWIVAIKTLVVIHRALREADPTFREELINYSYRGQILEMSHFKDDSSPLAWDCSAWVRAYAHFLEERLECFRVLKYDIESDRLAKTPLRATKVHNRTRYLDGDGLLEQLPALQQLLYRLTGCQPEGAAYHNYLIQYALALVLKESFKIYCAINDGIINLVDMFFEMSRPEAVKALEIYKRAGQQAESLDDFYEFCKGLDIARNFQFPILRQPPPTFLATMEEYIKEGSRTSSVSNRSPEMAQEENELEESDKEVEEVEEKETKVDAQEESTDKNDNVVAPLISAEDTGDDLLGLKEINPRAVELEESNALALAIIPPGNDPQSMNRGWNDIGNTSGWELALVTAPSNINNSQLPESKMAGGFDKLLLDSLYEDDASRRQIHLQNAGYNTAYGYSMPLQDPLFQHDPFVLSNGVAPPTNVQMAQQQQQHQMMLQQQQQQQMMLQQQQQQNMMMMVPHQYPHQQMPYTGSSNPFEDPFSYPPSSRPPQGNRMLL